jgi:hypothetical protein
MYVGQEESKANLVYTELDGNLDDNLDGNLAEPSPSAQPATSPHLSRPERPTSAFDQV